MAEPEHKVTLDSRRRDSDGTFYFVASCTCGFRWEQSEGPFKCPKEEKRS